jgi:hypothetical protein
MKQEARLWEPSDICDPSPDDEGYRYTPQPPTVSKITQTPEQVLKRIAKRKMPGEMDPGTCRDADFEGAYMAIIRAARKATGWKP